MKKFILFSGILFCQLGFGMSALQQVMRDYLNNPTSNGYTSKYGFSHANKWLLEQIVDCTDSGHHSCDRLRWYLQEYAPLMCQRDAYYNQRPNICIFFDDLLQDQEFIKGLMRDHFTSQTEAKLCAAKIAEAIEKSTKPFA
ncbi:hypothetical protein BH09DEP1_BH09DEP1_2960 [soil metagenome]